ncbi:hypothetical protein E6Q11_05005 [Candidatus Dojkabacteria bacterium]|uniref:Uncharacterized protein n=1 Tax=Candidatus Dojkabacteria bacterium TaxID=2099670 RepID=A0A5C7J3W8_9BACT|nr:MAG: hypothetical protein E6Q11_05005 [Candidatus Dojkabacteria bacterium]
MIDLREGVNNDEVSMRTINDIALVAFGLLGEIAEFRRERLSQVANGDSLRGGKKLSIAVDGLEYLGIARNLEVAMRKEQDLEVKILRTLHTTWDDIGSAVGVSKQTAQSHYGRRKRS